MKDRPLSVTVGDTFNGHKFEETTTETGINSYSIDGVEVSKETWKKEVESAETDEMRVTAGEEPP